MGGALVGMGGGLLACGLAFLLGVGYCGRWLVRFDASARIGVAGLLGLGGAGTLLYLFSSIGSARFAWLLLLAAGIGGAWLAFTRSQLRREFKSVPPRSLESGLLLGGTILAGLFAVTGVLTPSTPLDWDSLAYHLAVPKIWLAQGHVSSVPFIHHSNFPAAADSLFLVGLQTGGQAGAKAFMFGAYVFGILAVYGLARGRYGERAAAWAGLLFAATPMAMWEAGSAYIDLIHGLYAGLALWLLADDSEDAAPWPLPALLLGFALGTKYTGLQAVLVAAALIALGARRREAAKLLAVAAIVGGWWYVKNWVVVGNPVYPFFYSVFGGKNWDAFAARIYAEEQATFGLGRGPGGLLGLAAVPGRFTNPGPLAGAGFAFVSLGAAGLSALAGWGLRPAVPRVERRALLACGLLLALWLVTSQQSRYMLTLLPLLAILGGGLAATSRGWRALVGANAAIGLFIFAQTLLPERMPFLSGGLTAEEYTAGFAREDGSRVPGRISFAEPAAYLNAAVPKSGGVALYDEVFGFLLDVPYRWAGPGHSTELDYAKLRDGADLARRLRELGMTHVYVNGGISRDAGEERFLAALGGQPYSTDEARSFAEADPRLRWKWLVADATARGEFVLDRAFGRRLVFRIK